MSSTMVNVISSTALIEDRRVKFRANRYLARDTAKSIISQIFDIIWCLENLRQFKLLNNNIPELIMCAYFIESVPAELLDSSRWLQEYKIYNDVNMADFKATTLAANYFMNNLFEDSLKISAYIGTWENKSLTQKLEKVKDIIRWPSKELDDEIKLNLAFQAFPKIKINILSGRELFADQFVGNILQVAADLVSFKGLVKPSEKGSLENVPVSELCCHCESSENISDNIGEGRQEVIEKLHNEEEEKQEKVETVSESLTTSKNEWIVEELRLVAGEIERAEDAREHTGSTESSEKGPPDLHYPSIRDFTIHKGKTLVEKIVSKWCFDAEWMYFIQYYDFSHDKCTEFHKYEVFFDSHINGVMFGRWIANLAIFIFLMVVMNLLGLNYPPAYKSGFYCNDPTLSFRPGLDTVSNTTILCMCLGAPVIVMFLNEMIMHTGDSDKYSFKKCIRDLKVVCYWKQEYLKTFLIGLISLLIVKHIKGNPRPTFFAVCAPDKAVNCTTGTYIEKYECTNQSYSSTSISENNKSFFSGHAMLATNLALFLFWYLHKRCGGPGLWKVMWQILILAFGTVTSISRINDHRHHWWDVLFGVIAGALMAVYTVKSLCLNFTIAPPEEKMNDKVLTA